MSSKIAIAIISFLAVGCDSGRGVSNNYSNAATISTAVNLNDWLNGEDCQIEVSPSEFDINLLMDNERFRSTCLLFRINQHSVNVMTQRVMLGGRRVPIVVYFPDNSDLDQSKTVVKQLVVYLVGGPGGDLAIGNKRIDKDLIAIKYAKLGNVVVKLGYSGTYFDSSYPASDLNKAADEVYQFVNLFDKSSNFRRTLVYGESLGAKIVLRWAPPSTV